MSEVETAETIEDEETTQQPENKSEASGESDAELDTPSKDQSEEGESEEPGEVEIIREGKGSQPTKKTKRYSDSINREKRKTALQSTKAEEATTAKELMAEENKLLRQALEQAKNTPEAPVKPNADDFDLGSLDQKFIEKQEAYEDHRLGQKVEERIARSNQTAAQLVSKTGEAERIEKKQSAHYDRADDLGAKDYGAVEDVAIELLGKELTGDIISRVPGSEKVLFYYGTKANEAEARRVRILFDKDPVLGLLEIGALIPTLKVRSKSKNNPDPDGELEGSTAGKTPSSQVKGVKYS